MAADERSPASTSRNDGSRSSRGKSRGGGAWSEHTRPQSVRNARKSSYNSSRDSRSGSATPVSNTEPDSGSRRIQDWLSQMLDHLVVISMANGANYSGTVASVTSHGELILTSAKQISSAAGECTSETPTSRIVLRVNDVTDVQSKGGGVERKGFKTDAEISAMDKVRERELERWQAPTPDRSALRSLEDTKTGKYEKKWDQFEANERMFGLKTDFHEEIYTTKLDRSFPDFKKREAEAARIAKEIESKIPTNPHLREERDMIDDSGLDEEEKYSGVKRPSRTSSRASPSAQLSATKAATSLARPTLTIDPSKGKRSINAPQIDNEFMGTFKQFVSGERERLQQKKQAHLKKEKDGRLQELMKFSKSFKLKTPVPQDIVDMLAKGRSHGPENADNTLSVSKGKGEQDVYKNEKGSTSSILSTASVSKPTMRMNANAIEFKPITSSATSSGPRHPSTYNHTTASSSRPSSEQQFSPSTFFGNRKRKPGPRKKLQDAFNPFQTARQTVNVTEADYEKPYHFVPTWAAGEASTDKSYVDLFPIPKFASSQQYPEAVEHQLRPSASSPILQSTLMQNAVSFPTIYGNTQMGYGIPWQGAFGFRGYAQGYVPAQPAPPMAQIPYIPGAPYMQIPLQTHMYTPQQLHMYALQQTQGLSPARGPMMAGTASTYQNRYPSEPMNSGRMSAKQAQRASFTAGSRPDVSQTDT